MAKIIQHSEHVEHERRYRLFQEIGAYRGAGYAFECTPEGEVVLPAVQTSYNYAVSHPGEYRDEGVQVERWTRREPAILECDCGRHVTLDGFTCTCDCGADYNQSGQRLAPREHWGEETGESLSDILTGGFDDE